MNRTGTLKRSIEIAATKEAVTAAVLKIKLMIIANVLALTVNIEVQCNYSSMLTHTFLVFTFTSLRIRY